MGFDKPFPDKPEELAAYDLIILADSEARALSPLQQMWLAAYVERGGRLLVLGGPFGLGAGGWADAPFLADLLPVTLHRYDLQYVGKAAPVALTPVSALAKTVNWQAKPVTLWQHLVDAKPGATIHVTAGGKPAIVTGNYGQGRVAVITIPPLGEAPPGCTPFWEWSEWPELMTGLGQWLLANDR